MDLKDLNNYQLVLLTLLVSFVTSIATGIITVYLLQQSPTVSSVINQVIQRTVEKVSPDSVQTPSPQVVFVTESDVVPVVAEKIKKSLVSIEYECGLTVAEQEATRACTSKSYGFFTKTTGEFFSAVWLDPLVSTAVPYPHTATTDRFSYTTVSKAENSSSYNKLNAVENKKISVPQILTYAKTLPAEGETLVLYDPKTTSVKKLYVENVDVSAKRFTVDRSLASYVGLPIVNLDGLIVGVVGEKEGSASLISSLEITTSTYTGTNLTSS